LLWRVGRARDVRRLGAVRELSPVAVYRLAEEQADKAIEN